MLLTMIDVVCCENPACRDFARVAPNPHQLKSYYCPVCGKISYSRVVDAALAESYERFKAYLRERVTSEGRASQTSNSQTTLIQS